MSDIYQALLHTPPLWINKQFGLKQFVFPKLTLETFEPAPIPKNLRLGHQVERIFSQLIHHSSVYNIITHSLQIKRGNITIGELDFILQHKDSNQLLHIELTYKFYIIDPDISEPIHRLAGPRKKDMFFTKLDKIKNQQLPLIHTPEGITALDQLGITPDNLQQECCFLAQLFVPYGKKYPSIRPLNTACISGFWIRLNDFNQDSFRKHSYYITNKPEWLLTPHKDVNWRSHFEILLDVNIHHLKDRSPLLWILDDQGTLKKLFIVFF